MLESVKFEGGKESAKSRWLVPNNVVDEIELKSIVVIILK